ncbi:cytochrome b/b6 domain-containing protein [Halothiobacillus sp. DCM-1]|uniref:cytochrome b/b6 domain-containing protein n=1 Tax=Halothiobacillus sp. DCM-1 TaxID=3112558 RepID=UPI003250C10F
MRPRPLWPLAQRLIHWGFVLGFAVAWWSGETDFDRVHTWTGYILASLVLLRLALGFTQVPSANWRIFFAKLMRLPAYLRGRAVQDSGLSPSGAASALILLLLMLSTAVTGWMLTLEDYVGDEDAAWRHAMAFNLLLGWVGLHVVAVLVASLAQRHNKLADMLHGGRTES